MIEWIFYQRVKQVRKSEKFNCSCNLCVTKVNNNLEITSVRSSLHLYNKIWIGLFVDIVFHFNPPPSPYSFFIYATRKLWNLVQVFLVGFSSFLLSNYTSLHCRICVTDFREGVFLPTLSQSLPFAAGPFWIGSKTLKFLTIINSPWFTLRIVILWNNYMKYQLNLKKRSEDNGLVSNYAIKFKGQFQKLHSQAAHQNCS